MPVLSSQDWDEFLKHFPNAHLLQSSKWGQLKRKFGWDSVQIAEDLAGAQILFKRLYAFTIAYIPKGPVGDNWSFLIPLIHHECKKRRAILLIIEPDLWELDGAIDQSFMDHQDLRGFTVGMQSLQPRRTLVIDISKTDEQLLNEMKQKTRYNIRLAEKKGIQVRISFDLGIFFELMKMTGNRDRFAVHHPSYYEEAYKLFEPSRNCALFIADYQGEPLAAIMIFKQGTRAWYFYGASADSHRELMPAYLLQWEGMQWAKSAGCQTYDLWGVPDEDGSILEANFPRYSQGLWGVYRFKRGFGGVLKRSIGTFEYEYMPAICRLYRYVRSKRGNVTSE